MMTHDEFESVAALDAVGAATPEEQAAMHEHLESCESCRHTRDEYDEAAALIGQSVEPVNPPAEVRQKIMDTITEQTDDTLVTSSGRFGSRWWLATAATLFLALWAWRELTTHVAREKIRARDAEIQQLTAENTLARQRNEKLNQEIAALASSDTKTISLTGQQIAPSASARVFLEPTKRRAVVFFSNLPVNPNDKSYQLWIIRADQPKPQSAGVFEVSSHGNAIISVENLPVATEIKALAVTMEPKGGVEQPTSTNFYLMGKS